ncbi:CocE/NonD family hydrolase [Parasphingorhabdus cellanae]|uniref:CocE/NonD family hydrolase n=1 Tax=Parasphingorhabdus cellanae TaxID=2806553 RepID=A0ABX7T7J2_9SPHN|nr:CocE/NonD family hydrolase [Parasphingorhabdus cellanae]QTD57086.1 CocE/NonD family hydrolase [Parasphingorhabdus cellanae]
MAWRTIAKWTAIFVAAFTVMLLVFGSAILEHLVEQGVAPYLGDKPAYTHEAGRTFDYRVKMDDGVMLQTEVFLPEGEGPWPTVLVRDAYSFNKHLFCHPLVRYGYACVHQDVRGRFASEGQWHPFVNEAKDGKAALDWLVDQDWQNGNIAMIGFSYLAVSQWAVVDRLPPEVKTIIPMLGHGDVYDIVYRGGHFAQGVTGLWSTELFMPASKRDDAVNIWQNQVVPARPALNVDSTLFGAAWPAYRHFISHPLRSDSYWQRAEYKQLRRAHRSIDVPVLWVAGWHDFFLEGTLERFAELPTRAQSTLLIQPGEHAGQTGDLRVEDTSAQYFRSALGWLDHHLRGKPLPDYLSPGVLYYRNGVDRWAKSSAWPPVSQPTTLQLSRLDKASRCGGILVTGDKVIPGHPAATFTYDPASPAPTVGGAYMLNASVAPPAVASQGTTVCERDDVLSFISVPFEKAQRLAGPVFTDLEVSSNAQDTAFFVRISEIFEDGRILNIRDDILALSARDGDALETEYQPGDRVGLNFRMTPIDWTLTAGSRIRLDISSSNAPAFAAHFNRSGLWSAQAEPKIAKQTVYVGSVELPVVSMAD